MKELASGAMMAMYLIAGLFFLRFWKRTGDLLFAFFAVAFWILSAQRLALGLTHEGFENDLWFYVLRAIAFLLIIVGILLKNRSQRSSDK